MNQKKTWGQIAKELISFSVPLILSGLLQQLFSWVDAMIVGNVVGEAALAGVGATSSVYNLFISILMGYTSGLSVLFAQQYGKGEHGENRKLLAGNCIILCAIFTAVAALGMIFITPLLGLMNTPEQLFHHTRNYLSILLVGIPFLAAYNLYAAALRGMGNSKVPFAAVVISSGANVTMDYLFVVLGGLGVAGAAAATAISQIAMTIFIVAYVTKKHPELRFLVLNTEFFRNVARKGSRYGAPPAIQSSVSSVGNLFLQRFMNGLGAQTVAAITTAYRIDSVLLLPVFNLSSAIATLVAQQTGAGDKEAANRILKLGTVLMSGICLILTVVILLLGKALLSLFGLSPESVQIGCDFFRRLAVFYIVCGLGMCVRGYLEGTADLLFCGIIGICSLGVRLVCSYLFVGIWGSMVVAYAEAISWFFLLGVTLWRFRKKLKE